MDVVSSPWRVDYNSMRSGKGPGSGDKDELGETKHGDGLVVGREAVARQRWFCLAMRWGAQSDSL